MSGRFEFSRPQRRSATDPWFRVGTVDVGSAALLASLAALSFVVYAIEGPQHPILSRLTLDASDVQQGQVWRIATWPLANVPDIWVALTIFLLWSFGSRLEAETGRVKMAGFLLTVIVVPGIVSTLLGLDQAGLDIVQLLVLLTFVAEYPHVRFFFGIPAWVLGVVITVLTIVQLTGNRDGSGLLFYLSALATGAIAGRAIGLLTAYPIIPKVPLPNPRGRTPKRAAKPKGKAVVQGPWGETSFTPTTADDQAELDQLLDKISAGGMESLSKNDKQRLNELSKRLRGS
jgi:membrane associated rhomboid family serine protease